MGRTEFEEERSQYELRLAEKGAEIKELVEKLEEEQNKKKS